MALFEGKLQARAEQISAVVLLERELKQLLALNEEPNGKKLPLVLLAQFGCGVGKSAIEVVIAKHMAAQDPLAKVLVCAPDEWVTYQLTEHFQTTKLLSQIQKSHGIFLLEHAELERMAEEDLRETVLVVDEVDRLLADSFLTAKALKAKAVIGLSATLGGRQGLENYADFFSGAAHYKYVMPMEEKINFDHLVWRTWLNPITNKKIPIQELADLVELYHSEKQLPTVILAENGAHA